MNQSAGTRDRLLLHARELFSTHGFNGTSVRAITAAAKANLGAVTYHFGSKRRLYEAVLARLLNDLADRVAAAAAEPGAPLERLHRIVHALFQYFADNPDVPRILLRQVLRSEKPPKPAVHAMRRVLEDMTAVIRTGQASRELREVEPLLAVFTILSQSIWFAAARRSIATVSGVPFDRPEMTATVERHVAQVVSLSFGGASKRKVS